MSAQIIKLSPPRRMRMRQSLSDQDCFRIAAALHAMPGRWDAQRDEDADGVVAMALFATDDAEPAFVVWRDPEGLQLEDERAQALGRYDDVESLMRAAQRMMGH